jgi:transposase-like protein
LKAIYQAPSLAVAEEKLTDFASQWGQIYPLVLASWQRNCLYLTAPAARPVFRLPVDYSEVHLHEHHG